MIRWLLIVLAGCGRVGFEARLAPDGPPVECPSTYTVVGTGCYRVVENSSEFDWLVNETLCEADAPTAHLAVIDDQAELDVIVAILEENTIVDVALGFSDRIVEGDYRTVTGKPAFIVFASNEPDGDGEDCGGFDRGGVVGMEDIACDAANDYICEVDNDAADPSAF